MHLDLHVGGDFESAMRMIELDARDNVSKRVSLRGFPVISRRDVDDMLQTLLVRRGPGNQMKQLVRMYDIITVTRSFQPLGIEG